MTTDTKDIKSISPPELIITSDGSHSLYLKDLDEPYHSFHGAIQESKHVFIEAGLKQLLPIKNNINILEIGLGTGLNALLTLIESSSNNCHIHYTSIEAYPVDFATVNQLNYLDLLEARESQEENFHTIHTSEWEKDIPINTKFTLHKKRDKLQDIHFQSKFDLTYFDAFGPPTQPEMWTEAIFQKIFDSTISGGILVTYCAKGIVKRTLKKVGFQIETLPGPPRKREMIRATKSN